MLEHGRVAEEGSAVEVVRAYHRRLVRRAADPVARRDGGSSELCRVHEVRAVTGDGTVRDRVTEGEPVTLEVWLYAEGGLEDARATVGFRDANGRPIGSQTLEGVRLRPARLERLRLRFPGLPMREGRFFVDVGVATEDAEELALAERALELSVFSHDAGGSGPIRLGGSWELPDPGDG
jgi:hypothetical protein